MTGKVESQSELGELTQILPKGQENPSLRLQDWGNAGIPF